MKLEYEFFMEKALGQARMAYDAGQFPVGCVIVQGGTVIAEGARTGTDKTAPFFNEIDHAEIRALKSLACGRAGFSARDATLFCTMEPCLMCFSAIILSGIKTIVYAYEDVMGGGTKADLNRLPALYRDADVAVIPHVLREKSLDLFYDFFNKEDNLYWRNSMLEKYTLAEKEKNR